MLCEYRRRIPDQVQRHDCDFLIDQAAAYNGSGATGQLENFHPRFSVWPLMHTWAIMLQCRLQPVDRTSVAQLEFRTPHEYNVHFYLYGMLD